MNFKKEKNWKKLLLTAELLSENKNKIKHLNYDQLKFDHKVLVIDPKKLTSQNLYQKLLNLFLKTDKTIELDFASFVNVTKTVILEEQLAVVLCAVIEFGKNLFPFCLKTETKLSLKHTLINTKGFEKIIRECDTLASGQTFARKLQDMPSNYLNPTVFVEEVQKLFASVSNVKINVLNHQQLLEKKMGLICGVAQGSEMGAKLMSLEYNTDPKKEKLAIVGKGVCFDTGGYSVKTGGHMRGMKFDMSGAASVIGAIYALAKNQIKTNVVGVVGVVENLISLKSYRVDDVLISYQGTSVEVDNTDAEGRLVLADCLTYAYKDLKANKLLSIATLTGAIIYALGATYAGAWSKYDSDWIALENASNQAGENVWRMPFHQDYLDLLKCSQVADIKNSVASPNAGSSRAANFLKEFTSDLAYYHLDIAGLDSFTNGKGSGPMVRTLYKLAADKKSKK